MKAMILAAGLGTRLRPLTNQKPKALVTIDGVTLLEHLIRRLIHFGYDEIIINTHHFAQQISDFIVKNNQFNIRIEISHEQELLDTGGALKKASWFFDDGQPFLLHNVDVITDLDYQAMLDVHTQSKALVTLAVRRRKTSRYFLIDDSGRLRGWENTKSGERIIPDYSFQNLHRVSFMGIHIISPPIFRFLSQEGAFSIISAYLNLLKDDLQINSFTADDYSWTDVGSPQNLTSAAYLVKKINN